MKKRIPIIVITLIFSCFVFYSISCRQPAPPKAVVFVLDENGTAVENARVVVKPANADSGRPPIVYLKDNNKPIADTQWTNDAGKVNYEFKYRAIYRVEVTKGTDKNHPYERRGLGALMLQEDKTTEIKIRINEQTHF